MCAHAWFGRTKLITNKSTIIRCIRISAPHHRPPRLERCDAGWPSTRSGRFPRSFDVFAAEAVHVARTSTHTQETVLAKSRSTVPQRGHAHATQHSVNIVCAVAQSRRVCDPVCVCAQKRSAPTKPTCAAASPSTAAASPRHHRRINLPIVPASAESA